MNKDLYETLGVDKKASPEEIKKTFREKSKTAHPDKGGNTEEYQQISHAYDVLKDAKKRQRYDTTGDDRDPEMKRNNAAIGNIIKIFQSLVQQHIEHCEEVDYIVKVKEELEGNKSKMKSLRTQLKKELRNLKKVMKRLKFKGKELDFIGIALEQQYDTHKKGLLDIQEDLEINYIALKLLKNYEFDAELATSSMLIHGLGRNMPTFSVFDEAYNLRKEGTTS